MSRRFGSAKALARFHGIPLIEHLQNLLLRTQVDEIIIVLGAQADLVKPHLLKHKNVKFVYNKDYNLGQTSSFKIGIQGTSPDTDGFLLLPVDYPLIQEKTIDTLIDYSKEKAPFILIPTFRDQKGHPPLFSSRLREEILSLDNACGLNTIAHAHESETTLLPILDSGVIKTFNTQEELDSLKQSEG